MRARVGETWYKGAVLVGEWVVGGGAGVAG